jgi:glucosamine 6-phosphate synthetase-like amidotransferase/phosphosugar isomerase protein
LTRLRRRQVFDEILTFIVLFIVLDDEHLVQILGNIGQVRERGASIIVVSCVENLESKIDVSKIPFLIQLQPVKSLFAALQACSALQMIAYYSSLARGLSPDQQVFDAIDFNHAFQ